MSYEVSTDSAEFRLTGAPYAVSSSAIADFSFDGKGLIYFHRLPDWFDIMKANGKGRSVGSRAFLRAIQ